MTTQPRVFVIQQPATFNRDRRVFIPKYDLTPAATFGRLVFILKPGNIFRDQLAPTVLHMRNVLNDFAPTDFLLAVGDSVAIAAAAMIAGTKTGGVVNMLKWDRLQRAYLCFSIKLNGE